MLHRLHLQRGTCAATPRSGRVRQHHHHHTHTTRICAVPPEADDDGGEAPPEPMGDWRAFRAKLISDSGSAQWQNSVSQDNQRLLEVQNPKLAAEEVWAHPTATAEKGGLLLATPDAPRLQGDDFFWQLVILVVQHLPQGSVGLVLNRPSGLIMGRQAGGLPFQIVGAPEGLQAAFSDNRVYAGGYSRQDVFQLLHGHPLEGSVEVVPGVRLGGEAAAVAEVAAGNLSAADFRFFSGAMVWGPGQLDAQVQQGVWYTAAAARSLVLKQCLQLPKPLWREVMELMGGEYAATSRREARLLGDE